MLNDPGLVQIDPWLEPYGAALQHRTQSTESMRRTLTRDGSLLDQSRNHDFFGLHRTQDGTWLFREWAPAAQAIYLLCDANEWQEQSEFALQKADDGVWELYIPADTLSHQSLYKLHIFWDGGDGYRIPAYAQRTIQDDKTKDFNAQVWEPINPYLWQHIEFTPSTQSPLIYEAHVGMASEQEKVAGYVEFTRDVLPHIARLGYNTIQLMGILEHPYYGSFGYHVSSFFAASSRFGTPDELKALIDTAHGLGIAVIIDLVHSHAVKNETEGLSRFDGTLYQYFHDGPRGEHPAWDSRCFDYGKPEVLRFLLSNCRYWLQEYHIDGFRFDGVTSMIYTHHGLEKSFTNYNDYFNDLDTDALSYLSLANDLIHQINPHAITVAEEMSGMPGIAAPITIGGIGFDYRLSMGVPDMWIKLIKEQTDEQWDVTTLLHELIAHRPEEKTISYAESHDQALVGDKTIIFRLIDKDMYYHMSIGDTTLLVERGIALHKIIRLLTAATNSGGYLTFMGNEFGHPEWIDFPREGNGWSYKYARRQWHLAADETLAYKWLLAYDSALIDTVRELSDYPSYVTTHSADHIVSFVRNNFLFVFNLHPSQSFTEYGVDAPAGKYELVFSSDSSEFGGQDRIITDAPYQSVPFGDGHRLRLYIPARTAAVYKRHN